MKILITGAAGYIGSSLVDHLYTRRPVLTINAYDNLMYNQGPLVYSSLQNTNFKKQDVTDWSEELINDVKEADVIIPLAAIVGAPACDKIPDISTKVNYLWFEQLLNHVNSDTLIIYPNTNSGYGSTGSAICTEETPSNPLSLYGKDKQKSEDILLSNHKNTIVFRLATVFGWSPRPRLDLLINNLTFTSKTKKHIEIFDAHFRRNYIHIKDICNAFNFAINNVPRGTAYNLGNDNINCTKEQLAKTISETLNTSFSINENKTDPDKRDYEVSSKKLYETGYKTWYNLVDGIKELDKFYDFLKYQPDTNVENFYPYDSIIKNY